MKPPPLGPTEKLLDKVGIGTQQAALKHRWPLHQDASRLQATRTHCKLLSRQAGVKTLENTTEGQMKTLHFLSVYLQSSKVDPGDESASCLRSSSLSRVTCRSWYKMVSSFSLICLVSITGGGDDALPVVPDGEINTWQWANASKEQYNFTKEVTLIFKKILYFCLQNPVQKWSNSCKFSSVRWKQNNSSQIPC